MKRNLLTLALLAALSGCGTIVPSPPGSPTSSQAPASTQQREEADKALYVVKAGYTVALQLATGYKRTPPCPQAAPLCHDADTLARLQAADDVAYRAIQAAASAIKSPSLTAAAIQLAVQAASTAIEAYRAAIPATAGGVR